MRGQIIGLSNVPKSRFRLECEICQTHRGKIFVFPKTKPTNMNKSI